MKKIVFLFLTTLFLSAESLNLYCGVTMSEAMQEIADKFEAKTGVKVNIIKGGSGKLYKTILKKKSGDLYFPGSYKFIVDDENNLFGYQKLMGYNKAVILVQKGNPKHIKGLEDFTRQGIKVVLGDKNSGSVGKITKRILNVHTMKLVNWLQINLGSMSSDVQKTKVSLSKYHYLMDM